jgi:hypothetical protein
MDAHQAELVTVISHTEDGRIREYIKNLIPVTEADRMKAAARLRAEEQKVAALVRDTDALLARAHSPSTPEPAAAARLVPQQQRAAPHAAPTPAARPVTLTAHAEAKRRQAQLERIKTEIEATRREAGAYAGKEAGKAVMVATLGILRAKVPPGTRGYIEGKQLGLSMQKTLKLLHKRFPTVNKPEFNEAFADAFMLGVHEAVANFEANPPAPQVDAGAA